MLANIPTYMVWDDHDIRDGWGSLASDSPTLVAQFPRGAAIFARSDAYFQDCRDVYWHFQACHNPLQGDTPIRRCRTTSRIRPAADRGAPCRLCSAADACCCS